MPSFNTNTLAKHSLRYYWRSNVAVVLGVAAGVAVLVGSLLVGASVKASLRDLALERLGNVTHALTPRTFFAQGLAKQAALQAVTDPCVPVVVLRGAAQAAGTDVHVPGVNVLGVDEPFWPLAGGEAPTGIDGRNVAINARLASDLGVQTGDSVLLKVGQAITAPAGSLFARRTRDDTVQSMRVKVAAVIPTRRAGRFTLRSDEPRPRNVYVSLPWLQRQLDRAGQANTLLVATSRDAAALDAALLQCLEPGHVGLTLAKADSGFRIKSNRLVLPNAFVAAARIAAAKTGLHAAFASVYLANSITLRTRSKSPRSIPYSVIAGAGPEYPSPASMNNGATPRPGAGEILLNQWAAADLGAKVGDSIEVEYYVASERGALDTAKRTFTLAGIYKTDDAVFSKGLVPEFEGITDAKTMGDWNPPFPMDPKRIRKQDEAYWDAHGPAPKAIVALEVIKQMWLEGSPVPSAPWLTTCLVAGADDGQAAFREIMAHASLPALGLDFRPVREEALKAAKGSSDFGVLFLSMSFFLVAAAAGFVGLLLRLTIERRANQFGILAATGFDSRQATRVLTAEARWLVGAGVVLGAGLGVGYAAALIQALRHQWAGATGEFTFSLHADPASLLIGALSGWAVAALTVHWAVRMLRRTPTLTLLAGGPAMAAQACAAGRTRASVIGLAALAIAAALFVCTAVLKLMPPTGAFFGIGAALLVGVLALANAQLHVAEGGVRRLSLWRIAWRGAARNRLRSTLTMGLLACASFLIVTVAANRKDLRRLDTSNKASGAGGFTLMAKSELPIYADLNTDQGRRDLGLTKSESKTLSQAQVFPFRVNAGDDVSCLNMQQPARPRVLGAPPELVARGGFTFTKLLDGKKTGNPWSLLDADLGEGVVPAFADAASAQWILKVGLGEDVELPSLAGGKVKLRLVGLLSDSIFASELLISDGQFRKHFGADSGHQYFLIDTTHADAVAKALRAGLGDMGFDVMRTADVLAQFAAVQNTYLSTFRTLGGLGLLLGTLGIVTVLLRSVVERRAELAMLSALGFRKGQLIGIMVVENGILLLCGLAAGTVSALIAVAPHLMSALAGVAWPPLVATLLACMAVGIVSCAAAAVAALRGDLIPALRSE